MMGVLPESSNAAHHSLAASLDRQPGAGDLHHVGRVEGQVSRLQVVQAHKADKEPPGQFMDHLVGKKDYIFELGRKKVLIDFKNAPKFSVKTNLIQYRITKCSAIGWIQFNKIFIHFEKVGKGYDIDQGFSKTIPYHPLLQVDS